MDRRVAAGSGDDGSWCGRRWCLAGADHMAQGALVMSRWMRCLKAATHWWIAWLMVVVTVPFGMFVGVRYLAPLLYGPPVTVLAARIMDGEEIHPGGFLRILITATIRNQLTCGGSLSREFSKFTRLSDGDVVPEISRDYLIGPPISRAGMGRYITDVQ